MLNLVWLIPLVLMLALLAGVLICLFRKGAELAHVPTIVGLSISSAVSLILLFTSQGGVHVAITEGYTWLSLGGMHVPITARLDGIGLIQLNVVTCISLLVAVYARGYMLGDPGYARFFAIISAFVFAMVMLVLVGNLFVLYAFWEGVGLCSYLLIGHWYRRPSAAKAAMKAFLVNRLADCAFLVGILLLWHGIGLVGAENLATVGRLDFDVIFDAVPALAQRQPDLLWWVGLLLLIGAIGKSAQFPFHVWLPDAMEGPTPVSALIHATTMVTAGVYLLARMSPLLLLTPDVLLIAGWLGAITAVLGGLIALFQDDLKRVLAYSTVSQLGLLFLAFGAGVNGELLPLAVVAAMFHLITHAFFKALLFLTAGNVMHAMGDCIDMRKFGGLRKVLPSTHILFLIGALALVGAPPLAGFWSKEGILGLLTLEIGNPQYGSVFAIWLFMGLLSTLLTAIYTFRAYLRTFWGDVKLPAQAGAHPHEATAMMLAPLYILAVGSALIGLVIASTGALAEFVLPIPFLTDPHAHPHAGWWLVIASVGLVMAGATIAYYSISTSGVAAKRSGVPARFAELTSNRFYLDEVFYFCLVAPTQHLSKMVGIFDSQFIDRVIRRGATIPSAIGGRLRTYQTGVLPNYALTMALGIVALVALAFLRG